MKIIKADKTYCKQIIKAVTALVSELGNKPFVLDEAGAVEFMQRSMDNHRYMVFIALDDNGKMLGMISAGESGAVYAGGVFGVIHEFYIIPQKRCVGIGTHLVEKIKQTAIERGWKRLEVGAPSRPEWKRTIDFYLREGFIEIGPRLRWVTET